MYKKAIVAGAGIVGLATARALAKKGYKVTVVERSPKANGASVRNFGMVWPVGQPDGELYERAMLSRHIWKETCEDAGIWYEEAGSLHIARSKDEWQVMEEFVSASGAGRGCSLFTADETIRKSEAVVTSGLIGSLWSPNEIIVDPRKAIASLPHWLEEKWGVEFLWGMAVKGIDYPSVSVGTLKLEADEIYICSGAEFETLYPELFAASPLTKCKLQMMRITAQPANWRIGPALCGALSLAHYQSFAVAPSLPALKERLLYEFPEYFKWGIHVMVSQNESGELTIGDSHEYGLDPDPFDKQQINRLVLDYLYRFAEFNDNTIIETWNGVYPKMINGEPHIILHPEDGVTIINGLGGAGMTLSFGLCEQLLEGKLKHST